MSAVNLDQVMRDSLKRVEGRFHKLEATCKTPWSVLCRGEPRYLTRAEYHRQMYNASDLWRCPRCGDVAYWSDENYENRMERLQIRYERQKGGIDG